MKLRDYQTKVLNELQNSTKSEVVVASSPNSGKTLIACQFMKDNPSKSFLVLTHGTVVLREQWTQEFQKYGLLSEVTDKITNLKKRIVYGLPHNFYENNFKRKFDYLIIDEAHEFSSARMVKEIKAKFKPKQIINLTGTPSKFIRQGVTPIIVPGIELIRQGFSSDLYVGLLQTKARIDKDDFNAEGDLTTNKEKELERTTKSDMESMLDAVYSRLKETDFFKSRPELRKKMEWAPTFGALHKTMVACKSIKQAELVKDFFESKNVSVVMSTSENDKDSSNIQKFKEDSSLNVLIVVDRGILGFNMPDLVNVIDMTCSRNVDRIYQLYARVMRKSDSYDKKYFFKLTPDLLAPAIRIYMNAALLMLYPEFLSKFNGKNLKELEIVVQNKTKKKRKKGGGGQGTTKDPVDLVVDKSLYEAVSVAEALESVYNKEGEAASEYAFTTFGKVMEKNLGEKLQRVIKNITEENLLWMLKHGKVDERIYG